MSIEMDEDIKRWTARRKAVLVLDIIQGKTTVSESSRQFDLPPSEIESWIDQAKAGMENALKAKPEDIREQYETFRSNQIREGVIGREEALRLIREENVPRLPSIQEYCQLIGLDFDYAMRVIDNVPKLY